MIAEVAQRLHQTIDPMVLYQDMTARDLIQQRTTKVNGDTVWRDSVLVRAARAGHIAVLDGIHRIHSSTISVLHRLVHDREMQLYDGRRLVNHEIYDELLKSGMTAEQLENKGLLRIHPSFRIVALADPPVVDKGNNWLTPEMLSLFMFHEVRNLSKAEESEIIKELVRNRNWKELIGRRQLNLCDFSTFSTAIISDRPSQSYWTWQSSCARQRIQ